MKTITKHCKECSKEYEAEVRYLNRGQGLFCSIRCSSSCHSKTRRVKHEPNTVCSWCGTSFYRSQSKKKNSKSGLFFCSKEHQTNAFADPTHPVSSGPNPVKSVRPKNMKGKSCSFCKKPFHVKTRSLTGLHLKCKHELDKAYKINEWLNGENNVTLVLSETTEKPRDTKKFVKEFLIDTRGDQCESCGFNQHGPFGSIIQMDHINGNCFDNRLENLRLLCANCHAMTETYGSRNKGSGRAYRRKSVESNLFD